ncbi:cbb3-type cytochrome c oxidase N-terminal domain-containing protein [Myroides guanonis]|uniref:Cytochrome c oxidase cbb3-type subunit 3 n=1 Tax=Myroides guanonis TaxID=1150112 RepID=A0A1I3UHM0_9FLAO|nr:cbb3-type cytochrome c oxidase N-terminal domain-containing protein [Myroides guanonis]SFJ81356.1 cytochrome c oxidase cbb3-type subunit 3 [Myroides guanonis]
MKKYFPVYVRVPLLLAIVYFVLESIAGSTDKPAFIDQPIVFGFLLLALFIIITIEVVSAATNRIMNRLMTEEERLEKERLESRSIFDSPALKKLMQKLTRTRAISEEKELLLDHDYDGIKELDNELPPWWVGLFYASIVFAVIYMLRFHVFDGDNQIEEYEKSMIAAREAVEEYKKNAPDLLTVDNVVMLTEAGDLAKGKDIFDMKCAVCHKPDGGGAIGPNLTDDYWILGGDIKDIFHTISEGGRAGKGMIPWKSDLNPTDIARVASYIKTLHGTNPPDAKEAEGDFWKEEAVAGEEPTDAIEPVDENAVN